MRESWKTFDLKSTCIMSTSRFFLFEFCKINYIIDANNEYTIKYWCIKIHELRRFS